MQIPKDKFEDFYDIDRVRTFYHEHHRLPTEGAAGDVVCAWRQEGFSDRVCTAVGALADDILPLIGGGPFDLRHVEHVIATYEKKRALPKNRDTTLVLERWNIHGMPTEVREAFELRQALCHKLPVYVQTN